LLHHKAAGGTVLPKSSAPLVATLVPRPPVSSAAVSAPANGIEAAAHPNEEVGESPVNQMTENPSSDQGPASCVMCMDNLMNGQARRMLRCGHVYHSYCISEWHNLCNKGPDDCPLRCPVQLPQEDAETEWEYVGSVDDTVENPDRVLENPVAGASENAGDVQDNQGGDASVNVGRDVLENPGDVSENPPHDVGVAEIPAATVSENEILAAAAEVSESVV